MKQRSTVIVSGALAGGLLAIVLLALLAGRYALETVTLSSGGDAQLVVTGGALYLATVVAGLFGGVVVSAIAYGASADGDASVTRFELGHVMPFGLVTAVAVSYSLLRAGLGIGADAEGGVVTTTLATLGLTALVAGIAAGALTAWVVSTLAARSLVGFEGEAAPASTSAMMKAAMKAVSGPMVAIVVIAALAISLAQLLLAAEGVAAIAIFSGSAAVVLLGAAAAAYLGGSSRDNGNTA